MTEAIQNNNIIEIRGHHLKSLEDFIIDKERGVFDKKSFIKKELDDGYERKDALRMLKIIDIIYNNDGIPIKITNSLDYMCKICKYKNDRYRHDKSYPLCNGKESADRDEVIASWIYNLKINKIYSSKKIRRILRRK